MSATRPGVLLRHLHPADPDDAALLARFADRRDPAAFAAVVRRHGPMVYAVCRRVTGHAQDAEDAFQAAFLVLARAAGSVRNPDRLGSWLYGVAVKVAGRARRTAARRRRREVTVAAFPDVPAADETPGLDIGPALHEELAALPAHHREPIVLCDLQGLSRADAAAALGVPEGTLSSRLANGRKRLAERLTRRGVALSLAAVPAAVAEGRGAVPDVLVSNTCGLVAAWAAGGAVPAAVVRLARGGFPMKTVLLGGFLAVTLAAGAALAAGVADTPQPPEAPRPPEPVAVAAVQDAKAPPEAKKDGPPAKLGPPRLTRKVDLDFKLVRTVVWSPDGAYLAVQGTAAGNADGVAVAGPRPGGGANEIVVLPVADPKLAYGTIPIPARATLNGFSADGQWMLTTTREPGLISGGAALQRWKLTVLRPDPTALAAVPRSLDVSPVEPVEMPGEADLLTPARGAAGRTVRYLVRETDKSGIRKVAVWTTDDRFEARWPNGQFEGIFRATQLSPDALRVVTVTDAGAVEAYAIETGKRAWATDPAPKVKDFRIVTEPRGPGGKGGMFGGGIPGVSGGPNQPAPAFVAFAARAPRLLALRGWAPPVVLDADTGKALPALEGVEVVGTTFRVAAVSGDGRLAALAYSPLDPSAGYPGSIGPPARAFGDARVTVWDTTTGKVVRTWAGGATALAFHPTRPVLAILEANGTDTRLGFWEFAVGD